MRLTALAVVLAGATAHADGFYYSQAYGISSARGDGSAMLGNSLHLRIAMGWRFGALTIGPLLSANLATERDDAHFGLVGGQPASGDSDLDTYGFDARYHVHIERNLALYVRGGPRYARGLGALADYTGFGAGVATGVQLSGRVRALGFLFTPLFFASKGPLVTASIFLDESVDWYRLDAGAMGEVSIPLLATSIGLAAGSHF